MAENSSCALFMILCSGIYNKELYLKRNIIKELYDKGLSKKDAGL